MFVQQIITGRTGLRLYSSLCLWSRRERLITAHGREWMLIKVTHSTLLTTSSLSLSSYCTTHHFVVVCHCSYHYFIMVFIAQRSSFMSYIKREVDTESSGICAGKAQPHYLFYYCRMILTGSSIPGVPALWLPPPSASCLGAEGGGHPPFSQDHRMDPLPASCSAGTGSLVHPWWSWA